jgi:hypothetical protein
LKKLKERAKTSLAGQLTAMHIRHAIERWETKFAELVAEGQRSPSSLDTYRRFIKNHLLPALGEVRIGEASTPRIDGVCSDRRTRDPRRHPRRRITPRIAPRPQSRLPARRCVKPGSQRRRT